MRKKRVAAGKKKSASSGNAEPGQHPGKQKKEYKKPPPSKSKIKKEPLPMKLRAFPQSFWQQPNAAGTILPTNYYLPLEEEGEKYSHSQVVSKANTELLFRLFQNATPENDQAKHVPIVRRGRPKKVKPLNQTSSTSKDEDPYFTSALIPVTEVKEKEKMTQEEQILAMISVSGENENFAMNNSYSERLSNLVINL